MAYQIDAIYPSEFPEMADLWEASVRATHHFLKEPDIAFFKPLLSGYFEAVELACVRDENGRMLGFSGIAAGKLEILFVHPDSMGKGIGKALLQHAIEHGKVTKVDVNEDNPQAVGFYEHSGFRTMSRSELDGMGKPFPILHMALKA